ncbi:MAG: Crp/Fnr family transcriptional regulator [Bacteroidales bacterium]|nr:Crp/Fnr family transcriptional regulator [Bacteroidales bacterium]
MRSSQSSNCTQCIDNANTIFSCLTLEEKEILKSHSACFSFKKGEIIYKEGEKPNGLICLVSGKVKIFKEGIGGREQIVRMTRLGGFIGYRALFAEENYNSSSQTIEDTEICVIEKASLYDILKENSQFALHMIKMIATELGSSNTRTVTLTQKHIRGRLAESLLFLKDTYGLDKDSNINVLLSREDIANLSNMTTSNAIRTLSSFSAEQVIAIDGRKIKILDMAKLERTSRLG